MRADMDDRQPHVGVFRRLEVVARDRGVEHFLVERVEALRVVGEDRHVVEPVEQHVIQRTRPPGRRSRRCIRIQLLGVFSADRFASWTWTSFEAPLRLYVIVTWSPLWWERMRCASSDGLVTAVPSTAVITSPACNPACDAGLPSRTFATCAPCWPPPAASVDTPRNTPLVGRGSWPFPLPLPLPGRPGKSGNSRSACSRRSLPPLDAVARPIAKLPPARTHTATNATSETTSHLGIIQPPVVAGGPPGGAGVAAAGSVASACASSASAASSSSSGVLLASGAPLAAPCSSGCSSLMAASCLRPVMTRSVSDRNGSALQRS